MNIVYFLLPIALGLGFLFLVGFIVSVWTGSFDELDSHAIRAIQDEVLIKGKRKDTSSEHKSEHSL